MPTTKLSLERPRVVCHVDGSSTAAEVVRAAGSYCRQRGAELIVVRVLEPSSLRATMLVPGGDVGLWGLAGAAAVALGLARGEGITARAVVRIGEPDTVLEEERRAAGAERTFTRAEVAGAPAADSFRPSRPARLESDAA